MTRQTATPTLQQTSTTHPLSQGGILQRKCATCGQHTISGSKCTQCQKNRRPQQQQSTRQSTREAVPAIVHDVLNSSGQVIEPEARTAIEPHFAQDFSGLQVHDHSSNSAPKQLSLNPPDDVHEQKADRFANLVLQAPSSQRNPHRQGTAEEHGFDLSRVRVHTDQRAAESAQAIGALAYTLGNHIVFAPGQYAPKNSLGKRLLAHEIAHVAQQRRGLTDRSTIQRFTAYTADDQSTDQSLGWEHPEGTELRVADDGQMVAEDNGWGEGLSKRAWTTPEKISESNEVLSAQDSLVQLQLKSGGQAISGQAPASGQSMILQEIEPIKSGGGTLNLASDCGTACRQVMGSEPATNSNLGAGLGIAGGILAGGGAGVGLGYLAGGKSNRLLGGILGGIIGAIAGGIGGAYAGSAIQERLSGKKRKRDTAVIRQPDGSGETRLTPRTYHGGSPTTPEEWSEELFKKEFGADLTRAEAYAAYASLSPSEQDAFDRKYGINKYAVPEVGQGLTVSTETDMPGFEFVPGHEDDTWNFHYAAAVLSSGHDYITLENAAGWATTNWIFFMYGPESKGQSFHEFQGATDTHGTKYSTFVVEPEE
ncbi:MAG: DUF4157 domain-containing protein [Cyanobacteria bacterium J06638_20]